MDPDLILSHLLTQHKDTESVLMALLENVFNVNRIRIKVQFRAALLRSRFWLGFIKHTWSCSQVGSQCEIMSWWLV